MYQVRLKIKKNTLPASIFSIKLNPDQISTDSQNFVKHLLPTHNFFKYPCLLNLGV